MHLQREYVILQTPDLVVIGNFLDGSRAVGEELVKGKRGRSGR